MDNNGGYMRRKKTWSCMIRGIHGTGLGLGSKSDG